MQCSYKNYKVKNEIELIDVESLTSENLEKQKSYIY